ncbi:MinD/ParA family ATP-binding protein [Nocardioides pacificus]
MNDLTTESEPVTAAFRADGSVEVHARGAQHVFDNTPGLGDARDKALNFLWDLAGSPDSAQPFRVHTTGPDGLPTSLVVTPDGWYYDERTPATNWPIPRLTPADPAANGVSQPAPPPTFAESPVEHTAIVPRIAPADPAPSDASPGDPLADPLHDPLTTPPADQSPPPPAPPEVAAPIPQDSPPIQPASHVQPAPHPQQAPPLAGPPQPAPHYEGARRATPPPEEPRSDLPAPGSVGSVHRSSRPSFITAGPAVQPASQGWRGALNKMGFRLDPGPKEQSFRDDVAAVSQHWPGPRVIAVANGKGSANKTPTTVMLSAVFARYGGAGVLAWDNNETRGSLAWRTQRANHESTVLDLLPRVDDLLSTTAQSAEMSYFTHHQPDDKYDVLWSDQSVAGDHVVSADDVDNIYRVASRYYRLVVMDSGNSERAPNWRTMIKHADTLVVPCTNVEDTPEAGALMLEALASRDEHCRTLAQNAVVIVSQRTPGRDPNMDRIARDFAPLVREVVRIPFDPALKSGVIHFGALRAETQRAWLAAAAAVARGV